MKFGEKEPRPIALTAKEAENCAEKIRQTVELSQNYQAVLNMDLLTFESRLRQYSLITALINKTIAQLTKRRKTHFNASFVVEHTPFPDSSSPFLTQKKCPKYFMVLKKMRVSAKQLQMKDKSGHAKKIGMQPDLADNKYKFQPDEDELLKSLVDEDNGHHDWIAMGQRMNRPPVECVRRHLELSSIPKKPKWTPEENKLLKDVVQVHGTNNWLQISNYFEGKTSTQCFHHWMKKLNPLISRGKWTPEEDIRLATAYKIYANSPKKQWNKIAAHIPGRTDVQCRERYCNILDPSLKDEEWTEEEERRLMVLVEEVGQKWAEIAKRLGNRTDNQCWRRWKRLSRGKRRNSKAFRKRARGPIFRIEKTDYVKADDAGADNGTSIKQEESKL